LSGGSPAALQKTERAEQVRTPQLGDQHVGDPFRYRVSATNHLAETSADMPRANFYQARGTIFRTIFSWLREELGPLTDLHKRVIVTPELARVETLVGVWRASAARCEAP
jgi:hypothetical protein